MICGSTAAGATDGVRREAKAAAASYARTARPAAATDTASVLGIPEAELTPKVKAAIATLMREVDQLRRELTAAQQRLVDLERLADQDALAPIPNRRAFVRELSRLISFSQRYGTPGSLIYFDINGFKAINDAYGHAAGDRALLHVANTLIDNVRESDVVGRLGGDEFGVILANADEAATQEKARGLAEAIRATPVIYEGQRIVVVVAYGTSTFRSGNNATEAMAAADRAMYEHKASLKGSAAGKPGA
ncbi:MAG: GGDEF domain-containing protein [Alphaproteobacteria bacterium]|nr:GGDEF domain-containing protein [Alphaproteobacteria bacterium]